jgi:hypothetical protein
MLCFRCEHRARYLESGHAPRHECGQVNESKCGCYMYRPVSPVVIKPQDGDPRPIGSGILSCRSEAVRVFQSRLMCKEIEDGFVILCHDEEETNERI